MAFLYYCLADIVQFRLHWLLRLHCIFKDGGLCSYCCISLTHFQPLLKMPAPEMWKIADTRSMCSIPKARPISIDRLISMYMYARSEVFEKITLRKYISTLCYVATTITTVRIPPA